MKPFEGSSNKALIRQQWDWPIIQEWRKKRRQPLSYFGLPGPLIEDLRDWRLCLGRCTGVERLRKVENLHREDLNVHRQIHKNVLLSGIEGFQLLRGQIEDIILDGIDLDNRRPQMSIGDPSLLALFRYDLINLDFLGGMGYKDKWGESKRVRALKKLLERQRGTDFLLLLTLNVRDGIDDELVRYLEGAKREASGQQLQSTLDWYATCGKGMKEYRLKAIVPLFIRREGEEWGFDCFCYPPLAYEGSGYARMVHFVFELTHMKTILHAHSRQGMLKVMDLPLIGAREGALHILAKQHPNFDFFCCESQLGFLPHEMRVAVLKTVSEKN